MVEVLYADDAMDEYMALITPGHLSRSEWQREIILSNLPSRCEREFADIKPRHIYARFDNSKDPAPLVLDWWGGKPMTAAFQKQLRGE